MKLKRIISLVICALLVLSLTQLAAASDLPDVKDHWAEEKVRQLIDVGAIEGYPDGTFKPEDTITRAEFSSVMWGALDLEEMEGDTFQDIEGSWAEERIEALVSEGVINPDVYGINYEPDQPITRQEIAMMVVSILEPDNAEEEVDSDLPFGDAEEVGAEFYDCVLQAYNKEIIKGYPDNTFKPEGTATRAEASVMAVRSLRVAGIITTPEDKAELPSEIEEWVEYSSKMWLAQDREYNDSLYLLVTYGEKPTSGYDVEITQVVEKDDEIVVNVNFTEPAEDEPVLQVLTYPYDVKEIAATDKPVRFVAEGAEEYVPTITGVDYLKPIVAQSDGIKVFSPAPDSGVSDGFTVEGVANVFEGTVLYSLLDSQGEELDSGITTGSMGDWGYIEPEITVPQEIETGEELLLQLYTESAKDGSIINLVEIDLYHD